MNKDSNPLLFIDTINIINESKEKENIPTKKKFLYRLDDIKAMLYYKLNILCEIKTKNTLYEGVVKTLEEDKLQLQIDYDLISIPLNEIEDINILKV